MILEPPESVQKLQTALQAKAKGSPGHRFYLLYDKLHRRDVLEYAYRCCKANRGSPGVDRQDFADIGAYGEERWLGELAEGLRRKTYRVEAVRRVWIPKSGGKMRPLGIPCIVDRTVMTAAVAVLAPIFEPDMPAEQHGYHANLSAHTAVRSVHSLINTGHTQIIEGGPCRLRRSGLPRQTDGEGGRQDPRQAYAQADSGVPHRARAGQWGGRRHPARGSSIAHVE